MAPFEWDFEPRSVEFSLSVRAIFNPSLKDATVVLPAVEGLLPAVSTGAFETFEPEGRGPPSDDADDAEEPARRTTLRMHPGAKRAVMHKFMGNVSITMDVVRRLQTACLPIRFHPDGNEAGGAAVSAARVHLGPLLLSRVRDPEVQEKCDALKRGEPVTDAETGSFLPQEAWLPAHDHPSRSLQPCQAKGTWTETIGCAGLFRLEVTISTDIPVLSEEMSLRLLPACFTVEGVSGLPNDPKRNAQFEDVYVEVYPATNKTTEGILAECPRSRSNGARPHNSFLRFFEPVIYLLGLCDLHLVREWFQHQGLTVEIHDQVSRAKPPVLEEGGGHGEDDGPPPPKRSAVVFPHGVARFELAPLLDCKSLSVPLRADVVPKRGNKKERRAEAIGDTLSAQGLLSEEGQKRLKDRTAEGKREYTLDYHHMGTTCTLRAVLAMPIPTAPEIQAQDEGEQASKWAETEQRVGETNIWAAELVEEPVPEEKGKKGKDKKAGKDKGKKNQEEEEGEPRKKWEPKPFRVKLQPADGSEQIVGPWRRKRADAEADERALVQALRPASTSEDAEEASEKQEQEENVEAARAVAAELHKQPMKGMHKRFEKYGRVFFILQDSDTPSMQRLLRVVREHNAGTLGVAVEGKEMETYQLSQRELDDPHLDLLTGFVIMDGHKRMAVIEGLRDGGLQRLMDEALPRNEQPNSESFEVRTIKDTEVKLQTASFKVLYHPDVGFGDRLYLSMGPLLKSIKLRPELSPIEELITRPELYSFCGNVGAETIAGMQAPKLLVEMSRLTRQRAMRGGSTFPTAEQVENLQILYGGYITDEEIAGYPAGTGQLDSRGGKRPLSQALGQANPAAEAEAALRGALEPGLQIEETTGPTYATRRKQPGDKTEKAEFYSTTLGSWLPAKASTEHRNPEFVATLTLRKSASEPNFRKTNKEKIKERSTQNEQINDLFGKKRERHTPFLDGHEVHLYSQQKYNSAELQKEWMRASMDPQAKDRMWTYNAAYNSCNFEFSGAQPPGLKQQAPSKPSDTYARLEGDQRPVFRVEPARAKEAYRKPARDISTMRSEELHEPHVEGEWFRLPIGEERRKPIAQHVRFDPDKIPHHRVISDQPFDESRIRKVGKEFGPRSMTESVHYHGEGKPGEERYAENVRRTHRERCQRDRKMVQGRHTKSWTQTGTRQGVADLDRREPILKDKSTAAVQFKSDEPPRAVPSIRLLEGHHERGAPDKEFQARLRENDDSPPYDAATGLYIPRDPDIGTKRAVMSGTLGKAPWRKVIEDRIKTRAFTSTSFTSTSNSTDADVAYQYFKIDCGEGMFADMVITCVPLIGKIGIPLLFAFMVVKLSKPVWGINLMVARKRTALMITLLDFVDSSTFPTMLYARSTFVFVHYNRVWFNVVIAAFVIGYLLSLFRVVVIAGTFRRCSSVKEGPGLAAASFFFVDLPFMVLRLYFLFIGLEICTTMLGKKFLATFYRLPIICTWNVENRLSKEVAKLVSLMPGADKVITQGKQELLFRLHSNLEGQVAELEDQKHQVEALQKQMSFQKEMIDATRIIQKLVAREFSTPLSEDDKKQILDAFEQFDQNESDSLDKDEVAQILEHIDLHVDIDAVFDEHAGDDGLLTIAEFTNIVLRRYDAHDSDDEDNLNGHSDDDVHDGGDDDEE